MKTHKVDVVSGYTYPNDKNVLWFDESENALKKYDGEQWVAPNNNNNTLSGIPTMRTPTLEEQEWFKNAEFYIAVAEYDGFASGRSKLLYILDTPCSICKLPDGSIRIWSNALNENVYHSLQGVIRCIYDNMIETENVSYYCFYDNGLPVVIFATQEDYVFPVSIEIVIAGIIGEPGTSAVRLSINKLPNGYIIDLYKNGQLYISNSLLSYDAENSCYSAIISEYFDFNAEYTVKITDTDNIVHTIDAFVNTD